MRTIGFTGAILSIGILFSSCKKDAAMVQTNQQPDDKLVISGYTAYDANGQLIGPVDTTDWLTNVAPPVFIDSVFNTIADVQNYTGVSDLFNLKTIFTYPNPFKSNLNLTIEVSDVAVLKLLIVNEELTVKHHLAMKLNRGNNAVTFSLPHELPNALYRVYYQFYNNNRQVVYRGFGDIKKY